METVVRVTVVWAVVLVLILTIPLPARSGDSGENSHDRDNPLVVAFSPQAFYNVDPRDAIGAARVWLNNVDHRLKSVSETRVVFYATQRDMENALERNEADILVTIADEFLQVRDKYRLLPVLSTDYGKNFYDELLLLVHGDSSLFRIEQLRGRSLRVEAGQKGSLPLKWVNTVLAAKSCGTARDFFGSVSEFPKASQTLMPVFFGKADACIASLTSFETMVELNPQIGRKLRILERSPGFVTGIISVRRDVHNRRRDALVDAIRDVDGDAKGKQIMTIFRINRMVPFRAEHLASLEKLYKAQRLNAEGRARRK